MLHKKCRWWWQEKKILCDFRCTVLSMSIWKTPCIIYQNDKNKTGNRFILGGLCHKRGVLKVIWGYTIFWVQNLKFVTFCLRIFSNETGTTMHTDILLQWEHDFEKYHTSWFSLQLEWTCTPAIIDDFYQIGYFYSSILSQIHSFALLEMILDQGNCNLTF